MKKYFILSACCLIFSCAGLSEKDTVVTERQKGADFLGNWFCKQKLEDEKLSMLHDYELVFFPDGTYSTKGSVRYNLTGNNSLIAFKAYYDGSWTNDEKKLTLTYDNVSVTPISHPPLDATLGESIRQAMSQPTEFEILHIDRGYFLRFKEIGSDVPTKCQFYGWFYKHQNNSLDKF